LHRRWGALGLVAILGCGADRAAAERAARAKAEQAERAARATAEQVEREARTTAEQVEREARAKAAQVEREASRTFDLGKRAKAELDKVYRTDSDYDLDVTATGTSAEHAAKLAELPHVTIGGVTVGYEQVSTVSTTGLGRSRHFRATWRRGDRDVVVGYQTSEQLDVVAFARLLDKLVPSVERALE